VKYVPILSILKFPDERLQRPTELVLEEDRGEAESLASSMIAVMNQERGFGLAAPQVAVPWRMFVMRIDRYHSSFARNDPACGLPFIFVNPDIVQVSDHTDDMNEGCLSFPGLRDKITRPSEVALRWTDVHDWTEKRCVFGGWEARCVQHEMDHLRGRLMIEHMLPAAQKKIRKRALAGRRL
jgi:peptide deformylase